MDQLSFDTNLVAIGVYLRTKVGDLAIDSDQTLFDKFIRLSAATHPAGSNEFIDANMVLGISH